MRTFLSQGLCIEVRVTQIVDRRLRTHSLLPLTPSTYETTFPMKIWQLYEENWHHRQAQREAGARPELADDDVEKSGVIEDD